MHLIAVYIMGVHLVGMHLIGVKVEVESDQWTRLQYRRRRLSTTWLNLTELV
jgi:hypothetical protein